MCKEGAVLPQESSSDDNATNEHQLDEPVSEGEYDSVESEVIES